MLADVEPEFAHVHTASVELRTSTASEAEHADRIHEVAAVVNAALLAAVH